MSDNAVGLQARLMSKHCRKIKGLVSKTNCRLIFINQIRHKIGVMFGSPETTTGGNALKFYATMRFDIRRIGQVKQGDEQTGSRTRVKMVKNKVAPPYRQCEFDIKYGEGVDTWKEILDMGIAQGLIKKAGSWFKYRDATIGQGVPGASKYLKEHPEVVEHIKTGIEPVTLENGDLGDPKEENDGESRTRLDAMT